MPSHSPETEEENEAQALERSTALFEPVVVVVGNEYARNVSLFLDLLNWNGSLRANCGGFPPF